MMSSSRTASALQLDAQLELLGLAELAEALAELHHRFTEFWPGA
jgi:hypothetical protein